MNKYFLTRNHNPPSSAAPLTDGRHGADEDAVYAFLPERFKESAERAVLRLKRHRCSGEMAKNSACCQSSSLSNPCAPLSAAVNPRGQIEFAVGLD
ncbi:MAG: hypothetical protein KIS67_26770 [Verrucomicrobiae bacterium]|nr:hypothetical protein [Verrucomicrobiae bacterium]